MILIDPITLETGQDVSSVQIVPDDVEFIFEASATKLANSEDSLVRILVIGHDEDTSRHVLASFTLEDTETSRAAVDKLPPRVSVTAECLAGEVRFTAKLVNRDIPLTDPDAEPNVGDILVAAGDGTFTAISTPPANYYFGTDGAGTLGYFPLVTGSSSRVYEIVPSGTINGVNDQFTLPSDPDPDNTLLLWKNGILMRRGASEDFTLSGMLITYNSGAIPQTGDTHIASYEV